MNRSCFGEKLLQTAYRQSGATAGANPQHARGEASGEIHPRRDQPGGSPLSLWRALIQLDGGESKAVPRNCTPVCVNSKVLPLSCVRSR
jgi:hypothetical protein